MEVQSIPPGYTVKQKIVRQKNESLIKKLKYSIIGLLALLVIVYVLADLIMEFPFMDYFGIMSIAYIALFVVLIVYTVNRFDGGNKVLGILGAIFITPIYAIVTLFINDDNLN